MELTPTLSASLIHHKVWHNKINLFVMEYNNPVNYIINKHTFSVVLKILWANNVVLMSIDPAIPQ